jgi:serine/threonine-protein kinase
MTTELGPGLVVAGRYRLDRLLGRGGMGQVWAVTHDVTHRAAALKLLNGPVHLREGSGRRFLREAKYASAVNHPNVVRVHDFFELEDGTPVMIMDLLEGETLGRRLAREKSLSLETAASLLLPVVSAVGTAHARGIIHRDLKPENVFLASTESGAADVRVLDFGIAKLVREPAPTTEDEGALTGTGGFVGTPCYMSPEQGFGETTVDHRTDIWSLGVVLYESLAGSRPVDGANVGQVLKRLLGEAITPIEVLVPDLPPAISGLVGRMLQRDPAGRPADLREVASILGEFTPVRAPAFDAATREAEVALDSSPTSVRSAPRAVVRTRTADASDPIAATAPAVSPVLASAPSVAADAPVPVRVTRARRVLFAVVAGLAVAGLGVFFSLRAGHSAPVAPVVAGPKAASMPSEVAPSSPPLPAPPSESVKLPPPAPRIVAGTQNAVRRAVPVERRRPSAAKPVQPAPGPSAHRGGLVDEPPF